MGRYRPNTPDVIHETVDGETLIIHTPSGVYYSLQGTGEYVWNALVIGHSPTEIAAVYADGAGISPAGVLNAVENFAESLVAEQLLAPNDQQVEPGELTPASHSFSIPALQKFTDMQELLLVDPIHEVDPQTGWPHRPSAD